MTDEETTMVLGSVVGPWSELEHSQFEKGIIVHGWGNWQQMVNLIPTRSKIQIKSHAQKFRKHRGDQCKILFKLHEEAQERQTGDAVAPTVLATKSSAAATMKTPKRRKSTTFRRSGSLSKSAINARTPTSSLVPLRSLSFTGHTQSSPIRKMSAMSPLRAESPAPSLASPPLDKFTDVTSAFGRVTLHRPQRTISMGSHGQDLVSHRRLSAPLTSPGCCSLMSSRPSLASQHDPQEDELTAVAAAITPTLAHDRSHSMSIYDLMLEDDDSIIDALAVTKKVTSGDELLDPIPLKLEVDDDNLDMIADFLDPSWNTILPPADATVSLECDFLHPITPAASCNGGRDSASSISTLGLTPVNSDGGEPFDIVRPNPQLYVGLTSLLTAPPDYNNSKEYKLGADGSSRMGIERGALCRGRVKELIGEHLDAAWWREETTANADELSGKPDKFIGARPNDKVSFQKYMLERLIALTAVMLDVDHWHAPREARMPAITEAGVRAIPTITDRQRFNDEDDTRHIGQLLSGLWERVFRSIVRDGLTLLESEGGNDSDAFRMERHAKLTQMVKQLDDISRQEGEINFSPLVSKYAQV